MKKKYEGVIVLDTRGKEEAIDDMISGIGREIEGTGAKLEQIDQLGKKEFAYNARHMAEGFYVNYMFEAAAGELDQVRETLKANEQVVMQHYQRL
ncbi:MAG: 30S ribosomal protein S6 [Verrucomicrobiota bacterium]